MRERLPIPTVDEVLESLNESTVFSKLDLRWLVLLLLMMEFSDTNDWDSEEDARNLIKVLERLRKED